MYQLYSLPGSCSTGIHALLNKLKQTVDITMRNDVPNYHDIVPTNQVPALQTGDQILTEGAAIVIYLLQTHGPQELLQDREFIQWLMFNYATLHPAYSKLFAVQSNMPDGEAKTALLQTFGDRVAELWQLVDRHLEGRDFMHGDEATVLDYLVAIYLRWGNVFPDTQIPVGKNVQALANRVCELPEFKSALNTEGVVYNIPENARAA